MSWFWHCYPLTGGGAAPLARAAGRVWAARPRVWHRGVVGRAVRRLPRAAAVAGQGAAVVAGVAGTSLVCVRLPGALMAAPVPGPAYYASVPWTPAWGYPGLPGWIGPGGGVYAPVWIGGPGAGGTGAGGAFTPGPVPPGVDVSPPDVFSPTVTPPTQVPEPAAVWALAAGLSGLAAARWAAARKA